MDTNANRERNLFKRGRNRRNHDGIGFALFLILFGGVYLLLNTGVIPMIYKPLLISWQMLLIVMGIWMLIKRNFGGGTILLLIGSFFIYPRLCKIFPDSSFCFDLDISTYWPLLLIVIGLTLVFSKLFPSKKPWNKYCNSNCHSDSRKWEGVNNAEQNKSDFVDKNLIFGSSEQIVLSQNFRGGDSNVMFGELVLDLRKASLAKDINKLETNVLFGNAIIYVPSHWAVEMQSSTVFAGIEDKRFQSSDIQYDKESTLIIKISAIFGGCEIRN